MVQDDHAARGHLLVGGRVDLTRAVYQALVGVGRRIELVTDDAGVVGDGYRLRGRERGSRGRVHEGPGRQTLVGLRVAELRDPADQGSGVGVGIVRGSAGADPMVGAGSAPEPVHVVDIACQSRDHLLKRRRIAAKVAEHGLVLGRPVDVVGPRTPHGPDVRGRPLLEHEHVAVLTAVGHGLVDDRGGREAGLRPSHGVVVDHDRDRQAVSQIGGGDHAVEVAVGPAARQGRGPGLGRRGRGRGRGGWRGRGRLGRRRSDRGRGLERWAGSGHGATAGSDRDHACAQGQVPGPSRRDCGP